MGFARIELPYDTDALSSCISSETVDLHYNKHHKTYEDNLNNLVKDSELENYTDLVTVIKRVANNQDKIAIFNNAAQVWNHDFYWKSMKNNGGGIPKDKLMLAISRSFSSFEDFIQQFKDAALKQFGSGWAWLVEENNMLRIIKTSNASTPITSDSIKPIITIDVWEHAYYVDYRNKRIDYINKFFDYVVNWDFAESNLS